MTVPMSSSVSPSFSSVTFAMLNQFHVALDLPFDCCLLACAAASESKSINAKLTSCFTQFWWPQGKDKPVGIFQDERIAHVVAITAYNTLHPDSPVNVHPSALSRQAGALWLHACMDVSLCSCAVLCRHVCVMNGGVRVHVHVCAYV